MDLILTQAVETDLVDAMAADVPTLAPVAANAIQLVVAPFTPSKTLLLADLTFATFTGSAALDGAAGAQQVGIDPETGESIITILAPAGGWRWECTVAIDPPETVVGVAFMDNALAVLLGTALLETPVPISAVGHFVDLGDVTLRFRTPISSPPE